MKSIYLYPAQMAVSSEPAELRTILGSCVAVALHDPVAKTGGLNHYLLPEAPSAAERSLRYGASAIEDLILAMVDAGASRERLKAKIYGGAAVLQAVSVGAAIGEKNIELARRELARHRIPIVEENVGGSRGRKILLVSNTFDVRHELMAGREDDPDVTGLSVPKIATKVRVLLVDDSVTVRSVFGRVLAADSRVSVVGIAADAYEARELLIQQKPDVVLLDIEMPRMSGVSFLEKIMKHAPTPVIMVSSLGANEEAAHRCLELGAVEFVNKPSQFDPVILRTLAEGLVQKILAAASVPLRNATSQSQAARPGQVERPVAVSRPVSASFEARGQVVLIGGNTGSQSGLVELLERLPSDTPPVVVVNSSLTAFLKPFLEKTQPRCKVKLQLAADGGVPTPGNVYFAPAEHHLTLDWIPGGPYRMVVQKGLPFHSQIPSTGQLFVSMISQNRSLAGVSAVLLSGFGDDGAPELAGLRERGAYCVVANPETAPFAFLPGNALRHGGADDVVEPVDIPALLLRARNRAVTGT